MLMDGIGIDGPKHKDIARAIVKHAPLRENFEEVDAMDQALDAIYFAIGALHKLGLSPEQIISGLQIVHDTNVGKGNTKDENGKVLKNLDFQAPEEKLQLILDKRIQK